MEGRDMKTTHIGIESTVFGVAELKSGIHHAGFVNVQPLGIEVWEERKSNHNVESEVFGVVDLNSDVSDAGQLSRLRGNKLVICVELIHFPV